MKRSTLLHTLRQRVNSGAYHLRLPAERNLATERRVSRGTIRKALDTLEAEGVIWRHVGKGTFVHRHELRLQIPFDISLSSATPQDLMEARLMFEPVIAARAALSATDTDIEFLRKCIAKADEATTWEAYELWDRTLHKAIAAGARNALAGTLLDTFNKIRERDEWSPRQLPVGGTETRRRSNNMHRVIVDAIARRAPEQAADEMCRHLEFVRDLYFRPIVKIDRTPTNGTASSARPRGRARSSVRNRG